MATASSAMFPRNYWPGGDAAVSTSDTAENVRESDATEGAGRAGLAARGVLFVISAALTAQIALSNTSTEGPGKTGALKAVAQQPFGRVALVVLATGLAGYAIWRFVSAATYQGEEDDSAAKSWAKRGGYAGRGLIYVLAFVTAVQLILSDNAGGGGSEGQNTARVFDWPLGRWIVLAVGIGFLVAAAYNAYRAITSKYKRKWSNDMTSTQRRLASVVSEAGLIGHMAVFALTGFFLIKAAIEFDSSEPEGLDESIRALADAPGGTIYLLLMAVAMLAYAGFSFIEARWREVLE